ncbi:FAD:protein FMN transferase [Streptococcus thoraltensis]|uniref:FAD:protein FMN transferase n=1 Tax=Streptococcus thoraltensis TaxID=55085 RepID=UPI001F57DBC3|nr:FAD:protein FMN transferase [Streptococcus thoraltensis]
MTLKSHSLRLMGTKIDLLIDSDNAEKLINDCIDLLHLYNKRFSANDETSELMAVNLNAGIKPIKVHPELLDLIALGKKHSLGKPSHLNIAIGPLVNAWRIGFSDAHVPEHSTIQNALTLIDPHHIQINPHEGTVLLVKKGMRIDLGAIAKGYIADRIIDYLKSQGATSAMINLGGNVLVYGPNQKRSDAKWHIGIQHPELERGQNLGIIKIENQSVVTSGIYERKLVHNGHTYHHIFDSDTGYPIDTEMASITIVADLSVDCEIWTTKLFGLPIVEAMMMIESTPDIEGIIITQDHRIAISKGLTSRYQSLY